MVEWETVIGLECHVELDTRTKMFCGCLTAFGAEPNTQTCPVCLGQPGSLPVPNREAIRRIITIGLSLHCRIAPFSLFHRKNYFYPDMPKNYQISQYDLPICIGGWLDVDHADGSTTRIGITRVHMEEDTGKTTHASASGRIHAADAALLDFNRAGVPLVECVSEPDIRSPQEAADYLRELRATLEALDVSDVRMEEGSLRCDANISVRPAGSSELGTKVEVKNMNSVRSLERALEYEAVRQVEALERGGRVQQETRHWDEDAGVTHSLRSKEEAFDYRYFPEPDIPPIEPDETWIRELEAVMPELPRARRERYEAELGLGSDVARVLVADRASTQLFDEVVELGADPVAAGRWITQDVAALRRSEGGAKVTARQVAEAIRLVSDGTLSVSAAKQALELASAGGEGVETVIEREGLRQVSDTGQLERWADEVIAEEPEAVERYRSGKEGVIGFLVGRLMQKAKGAANPQLAQEILRERLTG